jgi:TolB-like protein
MVSEGPISAQDEAAPPPASQSVPSAQAVASQGRAPHSSSIGLWAKIQRHKVVEWTLTYVAAGFALVHATEMASHAFEWPTLVSRLVILAWLAGIPLAATIAWYHGHRAQHRISSAELAILIVLLVIAGSVLWFFSRRGDERAPPTVASIPPVSVSVPRAAPDAFAPPPHSVAVLPFTNLSGDPKQEYFSDGLSEETINALSHINALKVAARTSSFSFRGENLDVGTIARKLNVAAILEGSVRRSGNKVRITAQLINAVTGFHLWSEDYDRELKDVLTLQADIATAVARQLQARLLGDEASKITAGGTRDPEAYDAYLRGVQLQYSTELTTEGEGGWREALAAFDHAISIDPQFAAAYSRRAVMQITIALVTNDLKTQESMREQARQSAERAVALAPDLAEARTTLGQVLRVGAFEDAVDPTSECERALSLAPGNARVQAWYGWDQATRGHAEQALGALHRAIELDPRNFRFHAWLVDSLWVLRRYGEAIAEGQEARTLRPNTHEFDGFEWSVDLARHQADLARQVCERDEPNHRGCLALAYHALGRLDDARQEFEKLKAGPNPELNALELAGIYAQWGDDVSALRWLTTAERLHDTSLQSINGMWEFDPIRNEPDFQALLRRLHLAS